MVESLKLDEDPNGTLVDLTRYQGMAKPTEKYLTAVKRVFWYLKGTINMGLWYPKDTGFDLTAFADADHADSFVLRLPERHCLILKHSATLSTRHIVVRFHFIKEQVDNKIVALYFVKNTYQLADVFTKALARERFKFVVKRLGMQSITPEELKLLAESDADEE
ncbi:hypothetical protein Tco_0157073 [Tanacetum coccineum]